MIRSSDIPLKNLPSHALLAAGEISLLLDNYDDIFSSFDPRPYNFRALSDDFLQEAKRATLDKDGSLELHFLIPESKRDLALETKIRQRLHEHFKRHREILSKEIVDTKRKGFFMALAGILMIVVASYLSFLESAAFLIHFFIIVLEPAGWFTAWTGMDEVYYTVRQKKPDLDFHSKMMHASILFNSY